MTKKRTSPLAQALLETADGMHRAGILDDSAYHKITVRHLGEAPLATARSITGAEIRALRERTRLT
jgi:putative transcriptional regulator